MANRQEEPGSPLSVGTYRLMRVVRSSRCRSPAPPGSHYPPSVHPTRPPAPLTDRDKNRRNRLCHLAPLHRRRHAKGECHGDVHGPVDGLQGLVGVHAADGQHGCRCENGGGPEVNVGDPREPRNNLKFSGACGADGGRAAGELLGVHARASKSTGARLLTWQCLKERPYEGPPAYCTQPNAVRQNVVTHACIAFFVPPP